MFFIYRVLINLIILFSPLIIIIRLIKNKEDKSRFKEKFCFFTKKKNKGKLIWFHGSSVGEILSVIPLIEELEKKKSIKQILVTSSTLSSSKVLSKFKLKKTIHQFFPIDSFSLTKKFLNYWKPSIAIFIESEIWPNMIINIKKKSIPLVLLNARITKKSYNRWKNISTTSKILFKSFDICFSQNYETKKYLTSLGAKKIKFIGNLKFSEAKSQKSDDINNGIKKIFKSKKIWCAASTHPSEEKTCALAHKKLKSKYKNLLTIIIPRHIQRTNSIIEEIKNLDLKIQTRSETNKINIDTDIYLVDTYGESKSFYKICRSVFLGGSLINHGGQNPLEALKFGCRILHGPYIQNFTEVYKLLEKNNISSKFYNFSQLVQLINKSFLEKKNFSNKIKKINKTGSTILSKTLSEINFYL
tara:strand:- start:631 stop:1875 length:1245 start_codon:yes stop_codon:yes gene_type:complete